jgi:hypothetical protein
VQKPERPPRKRAAQPKAASPEAQEADVRGGGASGPSEAAEPAAAAGFQADEALDVKHLRSADPK